MAPRGRHARRGRIPYPAVVGALALGVLLIGLSLLVNGAAYFARDVGRVFEG